MHEPSREVDAISSTAPSPGQSRPPRSSTRPRRRPGGRILLSLVLFIIIVGGLAWFVQYLPSRKKQHVGPAPVNQSKPLVFLQERAVWDPDEKEDLGGMPAYAMECERGEHGFYDYGFSNALAETVELGLLKTNCDCSKVQLAVLPPREWAAWEQKQSERHHGERPADIENVAWQDLKVGEHHRLEVPGESRGLVRVSWTSRKGPGEALRLNVELWAQPKSKLERRDFVTLETSSLVVPPLMFTANKLSVGTLSPGAVIQRDVWCWSATRRNPKMEVLPDNPLIVWKTRPLSAEECGTLERKLRRLDDKDKKEKSEEPAMNTRVRSGFYVTVTVSESKDGRQLPQGPFRDFMSIKLDGVRILAGPPMVQGRVQGEVQITTDTEGKIDLGSFPTRTGVRRRCVMWAERGTDVKIEKYYPRSLQVRLNDNPKDSTPQKKSWELIVEVPAGSEVGPLPENSAVILQTQSATPRQIRIPVVGSAVQG